MQTFEITRENHGVVPAEYVSSNPNLEENYFNFGMISDITILKT
jgi:hypothetical protein